MGAWKNLLAKLGIRRAGASQLYELDEPLQLVLESIAKKEQRTTGEVQAELIEAGLAHLQSRQALNQRWEKLSAREQQVAALTCLGYTNNQIAVRLSIAAETVKTHMRNALYKFNLHSKAELRHALADWDFSSWEKRRYN